MENVLWANSIQLYGLEPKIAQMQHNECVGFKNGPTRRSGLINIQL